MVPTVDTVRYDFIVSSLILEGKPVLLVGPVGTGKTSVAQNVLDKLDASKYSTLTINMSSQVSSTWSGKINLSFIPGISIFISGIICYEVDPWTTNT